MKLTRSSASLFLLAGCWMILETESKDYNDPISPASYQRMIGQGFAAKYFTQSTKTILEKYKDQNIVDVYQAGFRNLRLRCNAWFYPYPYDTKDFTKTFLDALEKVVDQCLSVGVIPIISWANSEASTYATKEDQDNFVTWWKKVAKKLKDKDYRLGFNLVTELNGHLCKGDNKKEEDCAESISYNIPKYNTWMSKAVKAIRGSGGNNNKRILILGPPHYTAEGLALIDKKVYENDDFMMAEHHLYASGPNKKKNSRQYWEGKGTKEQRYTLLEELEIAKNNISLKTYWGAWMPIDNKMGSMDQEEAVIFAKYFVSTLKEHGIPWSMNALDMYYDTKNCTWLTGIQDRSGTDLNMYKILNAIKKNM